MSHRGIILFTLLLLTNAIAAAPAAQSPVSKPDFAVMRTALHHALALQFAQAIEVATQLEEEQQPTLSSQLTRGMIAYFQDRWQTRQSPPARQTGHKTLTAVLEDGQHRLEQAREDPWLPLLLGTAAIFDALLQQQEASWQSLQLFAQGRSWLQQALITHDETTDAQLGLGLLYFAGANLPSPLQRLLGQTGGEPSTWKSIRYLQRAVESGQFTQDVARTFLARVYEQEKRYEEAIALGQTLQQTFPTNGSYALLTARSQCAHSRYAACATTLRKLAEQRTASPAVLVRRDDRFDLYYTWGNALNELGQYDLAFQVFRQAINQDAQAVKDETLWAKYHLARHYERRGQHKTARQLYHTLLRSRNVEDLHEQVEQRLARLQ